jgi:hypothetical protein
MDDFDYDLSVTTDTTNDPFGFDTSTSTTNDPLGFDTGGTGGTGNPYDYEPATNPFLGPTTTYNPSSGTYTQVWDDGSTLVTDGAGNVVRSTNATDGPGIGGSIAKIFGSIGANASKLLAGMFQKPGGGTDWQKVATLGGGLMGLLGSNKGGGGQPSGYQGGIPKYTATREMLTQPVTDPARVPGSAGRRYFSDLTYAPVTPPAAAPAPETPATPTTPTETPAKTESGNPPTIPDNFSLAHGGSNASTTSTVQTGAQGGLMQLAKGRYLRGHTDGMEDKLRTTIDGKDPAALSHGEFVVPADVVSHLGNGNSDAGAKRLYQMMDRIRQARTGTKQQGKQIQADKYLPS